MPPRLGLFRTADDLREVMELRKARAIHSLDYLRRLRVISPNLPFGIASTNETQRGAWNAYQATLDQSGEGTVLSAIRFAGDFHTGNCEEKSKICYGVLKTHQLSPPSHYVRRVACHGYDHALVVVTDNPVPEQVSSRRTLSELGPTALIVDGWADDWYFPNVGGLAALRSRLVNFPNPRQTYIRGRVRACRFSAYPELPIT